MPHERGVKVNAAAHAIALIFQTLTRTTNAE